MKLSVIIITKNEENKISECLESLKFADETIMVDNGSTDKTIDIARKKGVKVFKSLVKDFSSLRNLGNAKSSGKWLLYIDADEQVTPLLSQEILDKIEENKGADAYSLIRQNYYYGKLWPKKDNMVRLIKKTSLNRWQGIVHESAVYKGKLGQLNNPLLHFTHDNFRKMIEKTNDWSEIEAKLRLENNHPPMTTWRFIRVLITGFNDSFIRQEGWRLGTIGLIESVYQSFSLFITYAKLWELQNVKKNEKQISG